MPRRAARSRLRHAATMKSMQALALVIVEVVTAGFESVVGKDQLDELALGQVGGLVEDEPAVANLSLQGIHRVQVWFSPAATATRLGAAFVERWACSLMLRTLSTRDTSAGCALAGAPRKAPARVRSPPNACSARKAERFASPRARWPMPSA
jgi:hypothetical protein